MTVPPETRRANVWLLIGLIVFSLALCASVYFWMRATTRAKGGVVDRQPPHAVYWRPAAPTGGRVARTVGQALRLPGERATSRQAERLPYKAGIPARLAA